MSKGEEAAARQYRRQVIGLSVALGTFAVVWGITAYNGYHVRLRLERERVWHQRSLAALTECPGPRFSMIPS
jgi:hypothetical protein